MAPEQAAGKVRETGPACDVWALGAILYECLTGRPPFLGTTYQETLNQVENMDPASPSSVQPQTPRDLATICLKCLEKDPGKRFGSAAALADDLRRFLDGRPILARPATARERVWKWARRHPAVAALSAALALVVVGGLVALGWLLVLATDEKGRADLKAEEAEREAAKARAEEQHAREEQGRADRNAALARKRQERADRVTEDIIAQAETIGAIQANLPGAKAVLDRAALHLENLAREAQDDPARRPEVAALYLRIGHLRYKLHQYDEAEKSLAAAAALARRLIQEQAGVVAHRQLLAKTLHLWAVTQVHQSKPQVRPAIQKWEEARGALEGAPDLPPQARLTLAQIWMALGNCAMLGFNFKEADVRYGRCLAIAEELEKLAPSEAAFRLAQAEVLQNKGRLLLLGTGLNPAKAEADLRQSRGLLERGVGVSRGLIQADPGKPEYVPNLAAGLNHLANTQRAQKDFPAAALNYREALLLYRSLVLAFPGVAGHRTELAGVLANLNQVYAAGKQWADAETLGHESVGLFTSLTHTYPNLPTHQMSLGIALELLATAQRERGRIPDANRSDFEAAVAFARATALLKAAPNPEKTLEWQPWADRAVGVLRRLQANGFFLDAAHRRLLTERSEFAVLYGRDGFNDLLKELKGK
jgi:hypothetical protein